MAAPCGFQITRLQCVLRCAFLGWQQAQKIGGFGGIFRASGGVFKAPIFDALARRLLDRLLRIRHIGTPIEPAQWQSEIDKAEPEQTTQNEKHGTMQTPRACWAAHESEIGVIDIRVNARRMTLSVA